MGKDKKLTGLEKKWILYDVGNSAFTMLCSTIIPIYFKNLADAKNISAADSTAYWGFALTISTAIIMILGPILGAVGDHEDFKKRLFSFFMMMGVLGCAALGLPVTWIVFLAIVVVARVGFSGSLVFYDAMLTDITTDERMDEVSSHGYAWGYIGSCIPFVLSLGLVLGADFVGLTTGTATAIAFIINAVWWLICSIPLLKSYKQVHFVKSRGKLIRDSFVNLGHTLKSIVKDSRVFTFLIAFFLYIDGVYTIIDMATSYGKDVGISDDQLLMALLLTQVIAFPFAIIFGKLTRKIKNTTLISVCVFGYLGISLFALWLDTAWKFWVLAVLVAIFQGAIQALSRSYFASIIPKEKANEYFGIYDIFGKGASLLGTFMMAVITKQTQNSRYGVMVIVVIVVLGTIMFQVHRAISKKKEAA